MALAFERARVQITNESGEHVDTQTRTFPKNLKAAEVAIQSFKLDLAGSARPTDIVQVTARVEDRGGASVTVSIKTNYSGGRYSGEVTALIIAELE
jgi:hypothetical protein